MATKNAKKSVKKMTAKKPIAKKPQAPKANTVKAKVAKANKKKTQTLVSKYKSIALDAKKGRYIACLVAEFIGTFLFIAFFMLSNGDPRYTLFAMVAIVLLVGSISGAIINPAMAISAWVTKKIKLARAVGYIAAQSLGAIAAWSIISAYASGTAGSANLMTAAPTIFTATTLTEGKEWYIFFAEILGALILGFGLAASFKYRKDKETATSAALVYGFTLYIAMFVTYIMVSPLGTGLVFFNPALAFAASGVAFKLWPIAIYIVAPIIGGVLGFILQNVLHSQIEISVKKDK